MAGERPTQADVARVAGVSQTTVSIVLNKIDNGNVRLAESTRIRVLEALERTGYIANPIARSLAGHRTNILGVFGFEPVFGSNSDSFYLPFMEGIEEAAEAAARDLLLFSSAARDGSQHHIYRQNENRLRLVDACVLIGNGEPQIELSRLASEGYPFVFIGRREAPDVEVPYVSADYYTATKEFVQRLTRLGHRRLTYIAASHGTPSGLERLDGMRDAMAEFGIHGDVLFQDAPTHRDDLARCIATGSTAIVVEPLVDIEELVAFLERQSLSIPTDISVALLGDPLRPSRDPRFWSGYRLPRQEMGRTAVEMLLQMLDSPHGGVRQKVVRCLPEEGRSVSRPAAPTPSPKGAAA